MCFLCNVRQKDENRGESGKESKKMCHGEFLATIHKPLSRVEQKRNWIAYLLLLLLFFFFVRIPLVLKQLRTSGGTASRDRPRPISDDRLGNSNGTILCNATRQPRATPSVNYVSSEWSYMLANASFFFSPARRSKEKMSTVCHQRRSVFDKVSPLTEPPISIF